MKVLNDYICNLGHVTERFIEPEEFTTCPICEGVSHKVLSSPRLLRMDGKPIDIMSDSWAKKREQKARKTRENNE